MAGAQGGEAGCPGGRAGRGGGLLGRERGAKEAGRPERRAEEAGCPVGSSAGDRKQAVRVEAQQHERAEYGVAGIWELAGASSSGTEHTPHTLRNRIAG